MSDRYADLREEAWSANLEIQKRGLAALTWGNASALDPADGVFAIKPSGLEYEELRPENMVLVDLDGTVVEGRLRPSSDTKTHLVLYKAFAGIRGICHCHSPNAVAWAQARRPLPCMGTTHADLTAGEVPCTEMISAEALAADYETGTGELIVKAFADRPPLETPVVLVAGHGPFSWGRSAREAVHNAVALEEAARMAILTLAIAPAGAPLPQHVVRKHYDRKHGSSAYYGQGR